MTDNTKTDDLALRQLYDEGFRREQLPSASRSFAALRSGDPGVPVLFVPGFTGSKEDFVRMLAPTAKLGYLAVAIDQRGQYETPGHTLGESESEEHYGIDALAVELLHAIDALGGRAHVVGHSFGGLVARAAAISRPASLLSLVLMDSGPGGLTGAPRERLEYLRPLLVSSGAEVVYEAMAALAAVEPDYEPAPVPLEEFLRRRFVTSSETMLLGMGAALLDAADRSEELRRSGVRLLLLHGEDEDVWLSHTQTEMAQRLDAPRVVIEKAAHSPALDNPVATFAALREFWSAED